MAPTMMEKIVVRVVVMVDDSLSDGDDNNVTEQSPLLVGSRSGSFRGVGQEDWDVIVPRSLFVGSCVKVLKVSFYFLLLQTSPSPGQSIGKKQHKQGHKSCKTSPTTDRPTRNPRATHNLAQTEASSRCRRNLLLVDIVVLHAVARDIYTP